MILPDTKGSPAGPDVRHLVATTFLFIFSIFLVLPFRDIYGMEVRAAVFVRGMLEGGSLFVPSLYGSPYTDYPPLFFLLEYLASLPTGVPTALSVAIPSSVSALCLICLAFLFARRFFSKDAAIVSALVLSGMPEFWLKAERPPSTCSLPYLPRFQ